MFKSTILALAAFTPLLVTSSPVPLLGINIPTITLPVAPIVTAIIGAPDKSLFAKLKCGLAVGELNLGTYNLGCLCDASLLNLNLGVLDQTITAQIGEATPFLYPPGSVPNCDGKGGYTCPNGKNLDGTCRPGLACPANQYDAAGICCPVGTFNIQGICCAQGQAVQNGQCVPPVPLITCASGLQLLDGICCGLTQILTPDHVCGCPAGFNSVGSQCVPIPQSCDPGSTWMTTRCCPNSSSEVRVGVCACPSGYRFNTLGTTCVQICVGVEKLLGLCVNL